jgi:hypothetical protein
MNTTEIISAPSTAEVLTACQDALTKNGDIDQLNAALNGAQREVKRLIAIDRPTENDRYAITDLNNLIQSLITRRARVAALSAKEKAA